MKKKLSVLFVLLVLCVLSVFMTGCSTMSGLADDPKVKAAIIKGIDKLVEEGRLGPKNAEDLKKYLEKDSAE